MSDVTRAVFDCNTLLQAVGSPDGPAGRCFALAIAGKVRLYVSPAGLDELRDVTGRTKVVTKLGLTPGRVTRFFDDLTRAATMLERFPAAFAYARDRADTHYVDLALASDAHLIVSRDKDLLDLTRGMNAEGRRLMTEHPTLRVLTPPQFLAVVDAK